MMAFFLVFGSFLAAVYIYTGFRLISSLSLRRYRFVAWGLLLTCLGMLIAHIYLRVTFQYPAASTWFAWIGYTSLGLVSYLAGMSLFRDLVIVISLSVL
ncbi:MAG: hypothetical protein MI799_15005, partial [Desulfobacterales bacterium]|nr:hypothetical protein [Desulfobacterales bacterium]